MPCSLICLLYTSVAGVGRVFGAGIHGKKLRPGENDIVFKLGIDKGLDVLFRSP